MGELQGAVDAVVIGAGIAGASAAAELSAHRRVVLLERESQPGYHTTGRSAALYTTAYGPPVIRALTRASGPFYRAPESPFVSHPLLRDRGAVFVARSDQTDTLATLMAELGDAVSPLTAAEAEALCPLLRPGYTEAALLDSEAADIDVNALHQHYLKTLRANGGALVTGAEVRALTHSGGVWQVETRAGTFAAPVVVNAAGAWADEIGTMAGARPLGLVPKRRTALIVPPPEGMNPDGWAMAVDADEAFYLKPDAGKLLLSPADETPSPPCDAQPDEMDVAVCIDRIERAFALTVRRIESKWAGLRSFLPDGDPAAGFDPAVDGFFWLSGQGGYGIQSAPALGRTAAALAMGRPVPPDIAAEGVTETALSPTRAGLAG